MSGEELRKWVSEKMNQYPELRSDIRDLYQLCLDEIEEGGSESHEIDLCINSINDLINDNENRL